MCSKVFAGLFTVFFSFEDVMCIAPDVNRIHEVRIQGMNQGVK